MSIRIHSFVEKIFKYISNFFLIHEVCIVGHKLDCFSLVQIGSVAVGAAFMKYVLKYSCTAERKTSTDSCLTSCRILADNGKLDAVESFITFVLYFYKFHRLRTDVLWHKDIIELLGKLDLFEKYIRITRKTYWDKISADG